MHQIPNLIVVSESLEDSGEEAFRQAQSLHLEGIMAKKRGSVYLPGKRSETWLKIKAHQTVECLIVGYTKGTGDREKFFGALHLARMEGNELKYVGKVGTGFDERCLKAIDVELKKLKAIKRPVREKPLDDAQSTWVEPKLMCEVEFTSWTKDNLLREPVFLRLRPDLEA